MVTNLCGRCLVVLNFPGPPIRARYKDRLVIATTNDIATVADLAAFALEHLNLGARLEIGDVSFTFDPVSTWHGDKVCAYHLYVLVEREYRQSDDMRPGRRF